MTLTVTLLRDAIDYAGLFPPAGLGMTEAVANYAAYAVSPEAWALGRFVLPASRLDEFEGAVDELRLTDQARRWRLSALLGNDLMADDGRVAKFNLSGRSIIDMVEVKAVAVEAVEALEDFRRKAWNTEQIYYEIPLGPELDPLIAAIERAGARAKVRTGGITPDAFPSVRELTGFISTCVRRRVPFKATAGLHHALRAEYPLTYERGSAKGVMFGFLNLFLATALLRAGADQPVAAQALEESSPSALRFDEQGLRWREYQVSRRELEQTRESLVSFGSCSFIEPIEELQRLHLIEARAQRA